MNARQSKRLRAEVYGDFSPRLRHYRKVEATAKTRPVWDATGKVLGMVDTCTIVDADRVKLRGLKRAYRARRHPTGGTVSPTARRTEQRQRAKARRSGR